MENSKIEQAVIKQGEQQYFQKDENTFRDVIHLKTSEKGQDFCF